VTIDNGPEGPEAQVLRVRFDNGERTEFWHAPGGFYVCEAGDGPEIRIADDEDGLRLLAAELHRLAGGAT